MKTRKQKRQDQALNQWQYQALNDLSDYARIYHLTGKQIRVLRNVVLTKNRFQFFTILEQVVNQ